MKLNKNVKLEQTKNNATYRVTVLIIIRNFLGAIFIT